MGVKTEYQGKNIIVISSGNYDQLYEKADTLVGDGWSIAGFDLGWGGIILQRRNHD